MSMSGLVWGGQLGHGPSLKLQSVKTALVKNVFLNSKTQQIKKIMLKMIIFHFGFWTPINC